MPKLRIIIKRFTKVKLRKYFCAAAMMLTAVCMTGCVKDKAEESVTVKVGSLKGPTTMGMVNMMKDSEESKTEGNYTFTMETDPSVITASLVNGDIDIALIPANMASIVYGKTDSGVAVVDINTLGVLEVLTTDDSITDMASLSGKTVALTGQGATPEYALNYLLTQNNVEGCEQKYYSEALEVAAVLSSGEVTAAVLPEPFATVCMKQNENVRKAFALTDAWDALGNGSRFLTGVTVVRKDFYNSHPEAVKTFLKEHKKSTEKAVSDVTGTAELVASFGIIEKAAVAEAAIPSCSIVCIDGSEMKTALSGYLQVLYDQDPKSVGGNLPSDDFYLSFE